jgi:hypothetical protein
MTDQIRSIDAHVVVVAKRLSEAVERWHGDPRHTIQLIHDLMLVVSQLVAARRVTLEIARRLIPGYQGLPLPDCRDQLRDLAWERVNLENKAVGG